MVVLTVVAGRLPANLLLYLALIAAVVFVVFLRSVLNFADKNPAASLLEGAELLQWQQTELAAKGTGPIPLSAALPVPPLELPPSSEGREE